MYKCGRGIELSNSPCPSKSEWLLVPPPFLGVFDRRFVRFRQRSQVPPPNDWGSSNRHAVCQVILLKNRQKSPNCGNTCARCKLAVRGGCERSICCDESGLGFHLLIPSSRYPILSLDTLEHALPLDSEVSAESVRSLSVRYI